MSKPDKRKGRGLSSRKRDIRKRDAIIDERLRKRDAERRREEWWRANRPPGC